MKVKDQTEQTKEALVTTIANELNNQDWTFGIAEVVSAVVNERATGLLLTLSDGTELELSVRLTRRPGGIR